MTNLDAKALEQRTRELFTECLVSLGAVKQDMDVFTVSREDIEQLVESEPTQTAPSAVE